ncbi:Sec7 domain containing protein [Histomonas meleagridis]|uniref:Sec7 domain containing protein n=1 Tax=Histomonas meleagridis TaxID=135588 RepID=UPI00355A152D|nr:Sec7 domain containing protein [Histomonas meleagridis]KAH0806335.1 Sec7 domain containing protein [Histomonas meleagridis]
MSEEESSQKSTENSSSEESSSSSEETNLPKTQPPKTQPPPIKPPPVKPPPARPPPARPPPTSPPSALSSNAESGVPIPTYLTKSLKPLQAVNDLPLPPYRVGFREQIQSNSSEQNESPPPSNKKKRVVIKKTKLTPSTLPNDPTSQEPDSDGNSHDETSQDDSTIRESETESTSPKSNADSDSRRKRRRDESSNTSERNKRSARPARRRVLVRKSEGSATDSEHGHRRVAKNKRIVRKVNKSRNRSFVSKQSKSALSSLPATTHPSNYSQFFKSDDTPFKIPSILNSTGEYEEEFEEIYDQLEKEDAEIEVVYQFNTHPSKNIGLLCDFYRKDKTPESIAFLMHHVKGLLGEVIGDYLSRKENSQILDEYFNQIDLRTDFVDAMRRSLSGPLYLPGEAQQIDRVVQSFSQCYMRQNPGKFSNDENPYILSFALIMLNSDLHNPNVQRRMTCQQFIQNTRGSLNDSKDITDNDLAKMYNELKENPFKFSNSSNEFMALSAPKLKGYVQLKMGKKFSKFTKKYFVLTNSCLYYFKDDSQSSKDQPQGMIQLTEVDVNLESKDNVIVITAKNDQIQNVSFDKGIPNILPNIKKVYLKGLDKESCAKWFIRIRKSVIISTFQEGNQNDDLNTDNVSDAGG